MLIRGLEQRFRGRVQLRRQGPAVELNWRRATPAEVDLVERVLPLLLPPVSAPPEASPESTSLSRLSPILEESFAEMNRMHRFLHPESFRALVTSILPRRMGEDAEHPLRVLDTAAPSPNDPESDPTSGPHAAPQFDLDRVKDLVAEYRRRRWLLDASSVTIRADSINRGVLDARNPRCEIHLEEGASLVEVIGCDADNQPIELASYLLTYDSPTLERWDVDIPGIGQVCVRFEYNADDSVHATFGLRPERLTSQQFVGEQQNTTKRHPTSRVQEHFAPHTSIGNADGQRVFGQFGSGCGKTSMISVGFLRRFLMLIPHRLHRISMLARAYELLSRHDSYSDSLQSRPLHQQREDDASIHTAEPADRALSRGATDRAASRQIDELVARQASVFNDFLNRAKAHGIVPGQIPCIHEPHARLSRLFGAISLPMGTSELVGIWFSSDIANQLSQPITAAALALLGVATLATVKMWWGYGWSVRLYWKYHRLEHCIALLRERLADRTLQGDTHESPGSADLSCEHESAKQLAVIDWRGLTLARTLSSLLQSPADLARSGTTSWIVNSMSEAELTQLLHDLGENRKARRIASAFINKRPIESVQQLAGVLGEALELPRLVLQVVEHDMNQALRKR